MDRLNAEIDAAEEEGNAEKAGSLKRQKRCAAGALLSTRGGGVLGRGGDCLGVSRAGLCAGRVDTWAPPTPTPQPNTLPPPLLHPHHPPPKGRRSSGSSARAPAA